MKTHQNLDFKSCWICQHLLAVSLILCHEYKNLNFFFRTFYKETEVYLPSRQMLQYDLVRLLRTAALLSRICQLSYNMYTYPLMGEQSFELDS